MKRLLILLALLAAASSAQAQYIGTVTYQTVDARLATNLACTGVAQNFTTGTTAGFDNLGQILHAAYLTSTTVAAGTMVIQGSMDGVNFQNISDVATIAGFITGTPNSFLVGSGRYTSIRVVVNCSTVGAATFSLRYSGSGGTPGPSFGSQLLTQYDKTIVDGLTMGSSFTANTFQPPLGTSLGTLYFKAPVGGPPANSSLAVQCDPGVAVRGGGSGLITFSFPLQASVTTLQSFPVPSAACSLLTVSYTSGGASVNAFYVDYLFQLPGMFTPGSLGNIATNITGTTATAIRATGGFLHTLTVNTGAAGTITVFDLDGASCTGTPSTNQKGTITATTATLQTFTYDINLSNGICVKASVAMDFTVSSQ